MATIRICIEVDNEAFAEAGAAEAARILRALADTYEQNDTVNLFKQLRDINGNRVGEAYLDGGRP